MPWNVARSLAASSNVGRHSICDAPQMAVSRTHVNLYCFVIVIVPVTVSAQLKAE